MLRRAGNVVVHLGAHAIQILVGAAMSDMPMVIVRMSKLCSETIPRVSAISWGVMDMAVSFADRTFMFCVLSILARALSHLRTGTSGNTRSNEIAARQNQNRTRGPCSRVFSLASKSYFKCSPTWSSYANSLSDEAGCGIVDLQKPLPQKASRYMALTGKQVRQLRALAHHLNPVVLIGKADVTDAIAKQAEEALEAHELIKCAVQDGSLLSCREAADQLAERTAPKSSR